MTDAFSKCHPAVNFLFLVGAIGAGMVIQHICWLGSLKGKRSLHSASHDVEFCARYADMVSMFFVGQILTIDIRRRFFDNSFYITAANHMSRHVFSMAVPLRM